MPTAVGSPFRHAQTIRDAHWGPTVLDTMPVGPVAIARSLGIDVYRSRLDHGVSGVLVKKTDQPPEIHLNRADPPVRRRFSCAHEIGHYVYRRAAGDDDFGYIDRRASLAAEGSDTAEVWANSFAAELLMPQTLVRRMHSTRRPAAAMAAVFEVSLDAMLRRLQVLKLR